MQPTKPVGRCFVGNIPLQSLSTALSTLWQDVYIVSRRDARERPSFMSLPSSFICVHLCRKFKITRGLLELTLHQSILKTCRAKGCDSKSRIHHTLSSCGVRSKSFFMPSKQSFRLKIFTLRIKVELHNDSRNNSLYKPHELNAKILTIYDESCVNRSMHSRGSSRRSGHA